MDFLSDWDVGMCFSCSRAKSQGSVLVRAAGSHAGETPAIAIVEIEKRRLNSDLDASKSCGSEAESLDWAALRP
jgi:hypothetical protein